MSYIVHIYIFVNGFYLKALNTTDRQICTNMHNTQQIIDSNEKKFIIVYKLWHPKYSKRIGTGGFGLHIYNIFKYIKIFSHTLKIIRVDYESKFGYRYLSPKLTSLL